MPLVVHQTPSDAGIQKMTAVVNGTNRTSAIKITHAKALLAR